MASLFEPIIRPILNLMSILNSPMVFVLLLIFVITGTITFFAWTSLRPAKHVLYFSEDENLGEQMNVNRLTPTFLYSKKAKTIYRYLRFREAFNFVIGGRTVTRWLAKKGTAFSKRLESGEVGDFTLFTIMKAVWGDEVINSLKAEEYQKLIESEVMITVRLEAGTTPEGYKPIAETYIKKESDEEMAKLFGENVRRELSKEDWIRSAALVGSGIALCYVAQAMGLLGSVS